MANEPTGRFWQAIGKISVLLTVIAALDGLYQHVQTPSSSVSGYVRWSTIASPDSLAVSYRDLRARLSPSSLQGAAGWTEEQLQAKEIRQKIDALNNYVSDQIPTDPPFPMDRAEGIWQVVIKNQGSLSVDDTNLVVPSGIYAMLKRENEPAAWAKITSVVNIGKLRPLESVSTLIWSTSEPDEKSASQLRLTYSAGIGRLRWASSIGYFGNVVVSSWLALFLAVVGVGLVAYVLKRIFSRQHYNVEFAVAPSHHTPSVVRVTAERTAISARASSIGDSAAAYFAMYQEVSERPGERDTWLASIEGTQVTWIGVFEDVSHVKPAKVLQVFFLAENVKGPYGQQLFFFGKVAESMKDFAYSLRKGDRVSVTGRLSIENLNIAPSITEATLKRIS